MKTLPIAAALALLSGPALATDMGALTGPERESFRAEVRAYLLENPEVLMEAIGVLEQRQAQEQAKGDSDLIADNAAALYEDGNSWVGGNPEGDVTIVEFLDYRCGYCRKAHPEVAELIESDGNIRLIVKEFPILGEQSLLASKFAIAVRRLGDDDLYKTVNDTLMTQRADITEDSLKSLAEKLDLDPEAVFAEMETGEVLEIIADNRALGTQLQINGTPSFVFGDQMLRGYVPLDAMREVVAEEREG